MYVKGFDSLSRIFLFLDSFNSGEFQFLFKDEEIPLKIIECV